jgi:hypothetical protein
MKPRRGPTRFSSPENSKFCFFGLTWTTPRQYWMDAGWTRDGRLELLAKSHTHTTLFLVIPLSLSSSVPFFHAHTTLSFSFLTIFSSMPDNSLQLFFFFFSKER